MTNYGRTTGVLREQHLSDYRPEVEVEVEREVEVTPATHQRRAQPVDGRGFAILAKHAGHRLVGVDDRTVSCFDCMHRLDLTIPLRAGSTSTSPSIPNLHDPARCPQHPGELAGACGPCRSERIAATEPLPVQPTGAPMPDSLRAVLRGSRRGTSTGNAGQEGAQETRTPVSGMAGRVRENEAVTGAHSETRASA